MRPSPCPAAPLTQGVYVNVGCVQVLANVLACVQIGSVIGTGYCLPGGNAASNPALLGQSGTTLPPASTLDAQIAGALNLPDNTVSVLGNNQPGSVTGRG